MCAYFADYWGREQEFAPLRATVRGWHISSFDEHLVPEIIDDREALASMTVPALVVVGRYDVICGMRWARELSKLIPRLPADHSAQQWPLRTHRRTRNLRGSSRRFRRVVLRRAEAPIQCSQLKLTRHTRPARPTDEHSEGHKHERRRLPAAGAQPNPGRRSETSADLPRCSEEVGIMMMMPTSSSRSPRQGWSRTTSPWSATGWRAGEPPATRSVAIGPFSSVSPLAVGQITTPLDT
jgi:hypothetical protein